MFSMYKDLPYVHAHDHVTYTCAW